MPTALQPTLNRLRRRMDSMRNTIAGIGGDKVDATRPDLWRQPLTYQELTSLWRYNGYCRRFVEVVPQDATRKGWTVEDADKQALPEIEDEHKRLDLIGSVAEADAWARLYGGAWILMVTEDDLPVEFLSRPSAWLAEPLDLDRVRRLQNLVVLDWSEVSPESFESDIRNARFRMPDRYRVQPSAGGLVAGFSGGAVVHASRMLYFHGAKLPPQLRYINNGADDSILQSVWDQARNKTTVDHGLAAVALELKISTLKMRDMADIEVGDEADYFDFRMRELSKHKSFLNTVLLADDEEYAHHTGTVSGMGELDDRTRQSLQAVTGMPEQLWIGSAPGGLSTDGESHRNLWANVIVSYQVRKYTPQLHPLYEVMFAAKAGPWGGLAPEGWGLKYFPLDELTDKGTADLRLVVAQTDAAYIMSGVLDSDHVAAGRFGENGWQMDLPPIEEDSLRPGGLDMAAIQAELARLQAGGDPEAAAALSPDADGLPERQDLAEMMTEHGVERCEHGRPNRCPQCGVERVRGMQVGDDGAPLTDPQTGAQLWVVAWRAIGDIPAVPAAGEPVEADPAISMEEVERVVDARIDLFGRGVRPAATIRALTVRPAPPTSRNDAADATVSICVLVPWPAAAMPAWEAARLEAATLAGVTMDDLDLRGRSPHVTVLWVGKVPAADVAATKAEVARVFSGLLDGHRVITIGGYGLGAFQPSPSSDGDTPLYIDLWSDALHNLHEEGSKALLTEEARKEQHWYSPHCTVGYFQGSLPDERWAKLWGALSGRGEWVADTVELSVGGVVTDTWSLEPLED